MPCGLPAVSLCALPPQQTSNWKRDYLSPIFANTTGMLAASPSLGFFGWEGAGTKGRRTLPCLPLGSHSPPTCLYRVGVSVLDRVDCCRPFSSGKHSAPVLGGSFLECGNT